MKIKSRLFLTAFSIALISTVLIGYTNADAREVYTQFGDKQIVKNYLEKHQFGVNWIVSTDFCYDNRDSYSSWDSDEAGGVLARNQKENSVSVKDTSKELPVSLKKQFEAATFGTLQLAYYIEVDNYADGFCWTLTNNGTEAMSIVTSDGNFCLKQPNNQLLKLGKCKEKTRYGFNIETNIDKKTITVYLNGKLVAKDCPFANSVDSVNFFSAETGRETVGTFRQFGPSLNRGYVVRELFESQTDEDLSESWQNTSNGGSVSCESANDGHANDIYKMVLDCKNGDAAAAKHFEKIDGKYVLDYRWYISEKRDGVSAAIKNGDTNVFAIETKNGQLIFRGAENVPIYDYIDNLWYRIRVIFDMNTQTADVYVNGKLKKSGVKLSGTEADCLEFAAAKNPITDVAVDDIYLYPFEEEPEDYVEEPKIPEKKNDNIVVGMQCCSLWREGHQNGFGYVSYFPERIPYLGYYDEGTPEVSDWEIKWMAEHGIDFQWLCWYRSANSNNEALPVKDTSLSYSIHDGYFYSKYSNYMKFAIFYENINSQLGTLEDFKENLVPYWIEYFFKDERYMKIDNRPIIGMFGYQQMSSKFGGEAGMKAAFDYLAEKCAENGIGAPIWILSTFDGGTENFEKYSRSGIDSVYSYHRGSSSAGQLKTYLESIKNNGYLNVIPSLSVGYNGRVWGQNKYPLHYGLERADKYADLCKWANDVYVPSLEDNGLSKNIVMIDTWNELGEGTYTMPTKLEGFGYLDAIRDAFTVGGEHEDIVPTDKQKDRFNNLFPDIEEHSIIERYQRLIPEKVAAEWKFTDSEAAAAWTAGNSMESLKAEDGKLRGVISGSSAYFENAKLNMDVSDVSYIKIRLKNNTPSISGKIEFIKDGDFIADQTVTFITDHNADEFEDVYVPVYSNPSWTGVIDGIRIYVGGYSAGEYTAIDGDNSFEIEEIVFLSGDGAETVAGLKYSVDGEIKECSNPEPVYENDTVYIPAIDIQKMFDTLLRWDEETQTTYIVKENQYTISMKINGDGIYVDGEKLEGCAGAVIYDDRTYVPIEFFAAMGYDVGWDSENNTILVDTVPKRKASGTNNLVSREIIKSFEFNTDNDTEKWAIMQMLTDLKVKGGFMTANVKGDDPVLVLNELEGVEASDIKNISIRYQNITEAPLMQVFFQTASSKSWTASKSFIFNVATHETDYTVYNIDPSTNPEWQGKITALRFDPAGWTTGAFKLDYLRLEGDYTDTGIPRYAMPKVLTDGSDITRTENSLVWNFDTNDYTDGWELNKSLGNMDINQGYLTATVVGNSPRMETRSELNIPADSVRSISIKLKNKTASTKAKLYYTTDKESDWSEDRCIDFDIAPNDAIGKLYILKPGEDAGWKDNICKLCLAFEGERGNIVMESVKINLND